MIVQSHIRTHRSCTNKTCTRSSQSKCQQGRGGCNEILQLPKDLLESDGCWKRDCQLPSEILPLEATHAPVDGPILMHT